MKAQATLEQRLDARSQRWSQYLSDLQDYAAQPQPLEHVGTLLRVTGLVLEAAGIRVPVGSVCEIHSEGQSTVLAEVVGFNADRAFLMPTGELHGLSSGARVVPRAAPVSPPQWGADNHTWRRSDDRGLHLPAKRGRLGLDHSHDVFEGAPRRLVVLLLRELLEHRHSPGHLGRRLGQRPHAPDHAGPQRRHLDGEGRDGSG